MKFTETSHWVSVGAGPLAPPNHGSQGPSTAKGSAKGGKKTLRKSIVFIFALMALLGPLTVPASAHGTGWPIHGTGGASCYPSNKTLDITLPRNVRSWTGAQELVTLRNHLYWLDPKTNAWMYWVTSPEYRGYANGTGMMPQEPYGQLSWFNSKTGALRERHSFPSLVSGYRYMVVQELTWTRVGQWHAQAATVYNNVYTTSCWM